jgi:glycolate oxidase FAD binding subunit
MTTVSVSSEREVVDAVRAGRDDKAPFDIVAGGTKHAFGRPQALSERTLDVSRLRGILTYEPEELILTARPGTKLSEIELLLSERGQRLGFDPPDSAALFGSNGVSTLGGAVSADLSGSMRVRHGGARDCLLGIRGVNGFGESFKAGGRVVKNVTGFDIPKLVCGAFGTLCVLTEMTFRVFPKASHTATLMLRDVTPSEGFTALRRIWSSPLEATGLAYVAPLALPELLGDVGEGAALFRVEGAPEPLKEKVQMLRSALGARDVKDVALGDAAFARLGAATPFAATVHDVWRLGVPPSEAARAAESIGAELWYGDLAGGVLWFGFEPDNAASIAKLRAAVARAGGHATLVRAGLPTRRRVTVFPQETPERAALTKSVKAAFDPLSLFNPGRMYEGV